MAGKSSKSKRSPLKRDKPVALVSADALTDEELLGRKGSGTAFTASLIVAVIVGVLAILLAGRSSSSSAKTDKPQAPPNTNARVQAVFEHLNEIDSIPYQLFVKADFADAVDANKKLPPLPENAFQNPYDIIPALAKAISDNNVAVCMQLVQLLLNEEKSSPVGSTIATSQTIGSGFGQKGIEVSAQPGTSTVHRNAMAYARLLWKSSEPFYFESNLQLAHLRVMLVHKFFDIVFDETTASSQSDKRRAIEMLGQALESRAKLQEDEVAKHQDTGAAWKLYNNAVALGMWGLPDQRPQHYFVFEESNSTHGDPFPSTDLYRGPVDILEKNWDAIRRELILHKKFPGKMDIDREHLAGGGEGARWLQADMLVHRNWDSDNVKKFPHTAAILKQIYDEYAHDLPDAIMQMSTMTKNTRVRPHCGSGNHKVRLHLALYIPKGVGIRIANETDCWENGKVLPIDDSYVHSVWNDSNEPRTVLIVDVWKAGLTQDDKEKVKRYFAGRDRHLTASSNQI